MNNYYMKKGFKFSEEHRKHLSEAHKGQKAWNKGKQHSKKTREKISEAIKKAFLSKEYRKKISEAAKLRKLSEETKEKISIANKGRKWSEESKRKLSKTLRRHKLSKETKKKISESHIGKMMKDENPNWQGGKSFEPYTTDWTETLKRAIRERDNYICQLCSQYGNTVHHKDYNKKNCNPNNLITLCISCNAKVNFNRDYWQNYFKSL